MKSFAASDTRQNLRNSIGMIYSGISNSELDLREVIKEFQVLKEHGSADEAAVAKVDIAHRALLIEQYITRMKALFEALKAEAGEKAMTVARAPITFG